jgi:hypothetical protein
MYQSTVPVLTLRGRGAPVIVQDAVFTGLPMASWWR